MKNENTLLLNANKVLNDENNTLKMDIEKKKLLLLLLITHLNLKMKN